jgi:hypothetical protein
MICPHCHFDGVVFHHKKRKNTTEGADYENAAALLANLTRQPIVSDLTYETLNAILKVARRRPQAD